jgi:hypothetical protein
VEYLYRKEYEVDSYGNPVIEALVGNLSGDDLYERYHIHREYHKNLLLKEETDSGLKVSYSYLPGTNLITSKIMSGSDGLYKEEYYTYDEYNNLIETLIDEKKTRYIMMQMVNLSILSPKNSMKRGSLFLRPMQLVKDLFTRMI